MPDQRRCRLDRESYKTQKKTTVVRFNPKEKFISDEWEWYVIEMENWILIDLDWEGSVIKHTTIALSYPEKGKK